jgi:hypothetical protein
MRKQDFIKVDSNYNSHLPLLWEALECTKGLVIEMGMGHGSTPFLSEYCEFKDRELISYENNREWLEKFSKYTHRKLFVIDWNLVSIANNFASVVFIDHAPGERRKYDIQAFASKAEIIVAHDTEPAADHGYQMRAELAKFKYCFEYETNGAWATAVSNFIDITKWKV